MKIAAAFDHRGVKLRGAVLEAIEAAGHTAVDLGALRRPCDVPRISRVRAVLSWGSPPSTTDPDKVPVWGNRIDRHVQIEPGPTYDGTAHFTIVGGVAANKVSLVTGLTDSGATLGTSTVPLNPPSCPFAPVMRWRSAGTVRSVDATIAVLKGDEQALRSGLGATGD